MTQQIGICSECGGAVVLPAHSVWPTPYCLECGAVASKGPRIQMDPGSGRRADRTATPPAPEQTKGRKR